MSGNITPYISLITSEYANQPDFVAVMSAIVQGQADNQAVLASMPGLFDIDVAVGDQLDKVGQWVGQSRNLTIPLTGVYFSFDTAGVGFDQGTIWNPSDPTTQLDALPDDEYRQLLYAKIANNQWQGNVPDAYKFMEPVFPGDTFFIQDNGNMTMDIGVVGPVALSAVAYALLTNGYFDIKPVGVRINNYWTPSVVGTPIFGFDVENSVISGFDVGSLGTFAPGV